MLLKAKKDQFKINSKQMKKIIVAFVAMAGILNTAEAQKDEKYLKLYYKEAKIDGKDITITASDPVSTEKETKFKLKIMNKSNDYVIYKPEESSFMINGKEMKPEEKWLLIAPNESDYRVINLKGEYNGVKNYSYTVGGLYKVAMGKAVAVADFKLPASKNDFKTENFSCTLNNLEKETGKTVAKFNCTYTGDKMGFVFSSKPSVKMPDGNDYACKVSKGLFSKSGPTILMKGKEDSFTLVWERMQGGKSMDMQKVEMIIKWNETFAEGTPEKMKSETLQIEFDEALSNSKRK